MRIVYSRAWDAGVRERVIEPYRLLQTGRGWEIDAGPVDERGELRTFLLANVRESEVLDETFEVPSDLPRLLEGKRATVRVRVEVPQSGRWAADMYAESVAVVEDRELSAVLDVELLPPLAAPVGVVAAGGGGRGRGCWSLPSSRMPGPSWRGGWWSTTREPFACRCVGSANYGDELAHHSRGTYMNATTANEPSGYARDDSRPLYRVAGGSRLHLPMCSHVHGYPMAEATPDRTRRDRGLRTGRSK